MLHVILFEPEIPPNTGNIIRLCANTGTTLHLIHPLGFDLEEKQVRRAGLDYRDMACVHQYQSLSDCLRHLKSPRVFACTTKGKTCYSDVRYQQGDALLMGPETRGLPNEMLATFAEANKIKIPMQARSRSINLSNATAIILFEAWRQLGFGYTN